MMQLRPILSTLRRHKTAALLIVLEIALTCAIVCNSVFLIANRIERVRFGSGLAESELVYIGTRMIGRDANLAALTREDLAALRAIPGVRAAGVMSQIPYGDESWNTGISLKPGQAKSTIDVANYAANAGLPGLLGLKLVAGRDFNADEVVPMSDVRTASNLKLPSALVTRAVADRLFPGDDAVGKTIYLFGDNPTRIVGVLDRLVRPQPAQAGQDDLYSIVMPVMPDFEEGTYMLRVDPARRDAVLKAAEAALDRHDVPRVLQAKGRYDELRAGYYQSDVAMVWLLVGVCVALLVVTAFGIVGLASFWVQQRTKMIGTRRALGATRGQILRYFQVENLLLTSAGIAVGMVAAFGINQWLMTQYELPRLPLLYLPLGAVALWALGQVAVLSPARRAAALPPALAMRGLAD